MFAVVLNCRVGQIVMTDRVQWKGTCIMCRAQGDTCSGKVCGSLMFMVQAAS